MGLSSSSVHSCPTATKGPLGAFKRLLVNLVTLLALSFFAVNWWIHLWWGPYLEALDEYPWIVPTKLVGLSESLGFDVAQPIHHSFVEYMTSRLLWKPLVLFVVGLSVTAIIAHLVFWYRDRNRQAVKRTP